MTASPVRMALLALAAHHRHELLYHTPLVVGAVVVVPALYSHAQSNVHIGWLSLTLLSATGLLVYAARQTRTVIVAYCEMPATQDRLLDALLNMAGDASRRVIVVPLTFVFYALIVGLGPRLLGLALVVHALNMIAARRSCRTIERALGHVRAKSMAYDQFDGLYAEWNALGLVRLRQIDF